MDRAIRFSASCVLAAGLLISFRGNAQAAIVDFNTTVDYHLDEQHLQVVRGANPNPPTVVHVVDPADIDEDLLVFDDSIVYMSGGDVDEDAAFHDTSRVYMSGGSISDSIHVYDSSRFLISGTTNGLDTIYAHDGSRITITGGDMGNLVADGESQIRISGGDLNENPGFPGEITLLAEGTSTILLYGSDFSHPLGPIPDTTGVLSGRLASGETFSATFEIRENGTILLIPEPTTLLLLALAVPMSVLAHRTRRPRKGLVG